MHLVVWFIKHLPTLFLGGILTSIAEYYFKYNLYDTIKDKVVGLFRKKPATPVQ